MSDIPVVMHGSLPAARPPSISKHKEHGDGGIPMEHGLLLAAILFAIGPCGLLIRRNLLFILMSIEIMMNASAPGVRGGG